MESTGLGDRCGRWRGFRVQAAKFGEQGAAHYVDNSARFKKELIQVQ